MPSRTTSGTPPVAVATTGMPYSIASISVLPSPSSRELSTATVAAASSLSASSWWPARRTASPIRGSRHNRDITEEDGPSLYGEALEVRAVAPRRGERADESRRVLVRGNERGDHHSHRATRVEVHHPERSWLRRVRRAGEIHAAVHDAHAVWLDTAREQHLAHPLGDHQRGDDVPPRQRVERDDFHAAAAQCLGVA